MAEYNYASKEINVKIVYYGPGLCGKTTNLQYIFNSVDHANRGEMIALATKTDRTLYFDFLPIHAGTIHGFKTRFLLYTVPGQVYYDSTRKVVLRGADGVIFVADSSPDRMEANKESLRNLDTNLKEHKLGLDTMPWVLQLNKRDLNNALPVEEIVEELGSQFGKKIPAYKSCAVSGEGVFETLHRVLGMTMESLNQKTIKAGRGALFTGSTTSDQKFDQIDWFSDLGTPPELNPTAEVGVEPPAEKNTTPEPENAMPHAPPQISESIDLKIGTNDPIKLDTDIEDWQPETSFPPPTIDVSLPQEKEPAIAQKSDDNSIVLANKMLRVKKTIDLPLRLKGGIIPNQIQLNLVLNVKLIPESK